MATWTNQNKNTDQVWTSQIKGGQGWLYDQPLINYDSLTEPNSGNEVLYDSLGYSPTWTNQGKPTTSWTNQNKN